MRPSLEVAVAALLLATVRLSAGVAPADPAESTAPAAPAVQSALPDQLRARAVTSRSGMVVTRNAAASQAGVRMLEAGGNAVDAAVAAALAMGVAEPGSCGIGGHTYILLRLNDGSAVAIDGSARAPLRADVGALGRQREVVPAGRYLEGYTSVATPGTVAALALALRRYGTKSLEEAIEPAIEVAEFGSRWSEALHGFIQNYSAKVRASPYLSRLFLNEDLDVWDVDHVYCNPDLACFMRRLAAVGADDFYRGAIAAEIDRDMAANGGYMRLADLALYEAAVREPLRGSYRGIEVLSFPLPGGGASVVEALGILDRFDPEILRADSVDRLHLLLEACHIAVADNFPARRPPRSPDLAAADGAFLDARARLIRFDRALRRDEITTDPLSMLEVTGTAQISTVDRWGNVASLTQTLGASFGGGAITEGFGFAYNNMLHGFDFKDPGSWAYLRPRQAPMTNMAPTILVKDGAPLLVLGSAGSARIASLIVQAVVDVVDRGLPLCEAIEAPRALWGGNVDDAIYLEIVDPITPAQEAALAARGFRVKTRLTYPASAHDRTEFGGVNAIWIDPADGTLVGVGDPRRQGAPRAVDVGAGDTPSLTLPACWRDLWAQPGTPVRNRPPQPPQSAVTSSTPFVP